MNKSRPKSKSKSKSRSRSKSRHRRVFRDNDFINWFQPSVKRMLKNVGLTRVSPTVYKPISDYTQDVLYNLLKQVLEVTFSKKKKTVQVSDVEAVGGFTFIPEATEKRCNDKTEFGEMCRFFPKAQFTRLVTQLVQTVEKNQSVYPTEMFDTVRWASGAINAIIMYVENVLLNMLNYASLALTHGKRNTLMSEDIELVVRTRTSCNEPFKQFTCDQVIPFEPRKYIKYYKTKKQQQEYMREMTRLHNESCRKREYRGGYL